MLRVCVIGMGFIGNVHADVYKADKLCELVGVCDIIKDRADAAAQRLGVRAFYDAIFAAFPDCRVETRDLFVEGDHLTWRFGFSGTHEGDFMGVPATGLPFDIDGITILRFGRKRCVERWSVADFFTLMIQIGAIPAPVG